MKKISLLSAFLLLLGLTATAQEKFFVDEVLVPQGRQGMMEIKFQFNEGHDYVSYQAKVNLPEGISFVLDDYDLPTVFLGDGQPSALFTLALHPTGHFVTCYSNPSTPIAANTGVLVRIPVKADESLAVGTVLNGTLTNVECSHIDAIAAPMDNVSFTVKVTDEIVLDEDSPIEPESTNGAACNVRVKRTIKAGEWSTLCLPFDMTEGEFKSIFGNDVQVAYYTGYGTEKEGTDVTGITINFDEDDLSEGFAGNYPYLIKTSKDVTEFTTTATIEPDDAMESITTGKGANRKTGKFIGTYQAGTVVPANSLFLSGNKFWYSAGKTKMKAFRAYFTLDDVLAEATQASARIMLNIDGETTGINENDNENENDGSVYDLLGRRVENPAKKGLYIRKGKKEVVH